MKIVSPKIKNYVEYSIIDSIKDNDFSNKLYNTNIEDNVIISDITFDSCIFNNINFSNIKFQKVFAVHGSFLILPKKVLSKIGMPYDEDMFLFAEEAYLAHLLKKYNIDTYITKDISVIHYEDGSMSISSINEKDEIRKSVIKYYEKLNNK